MCIRQRIRWLWLILQAFQDDGVRLVNDRSIEAGEVNLGGGFAVMAHTFADD